MPGEEREIQPCAVEKRRIFGKRDALTWFRPGRKVAVQE